MEQPFPCHMISEIFNHNLLQVNPHQFPILTAHSIAILQAQNAKARSACCYPRLEQSSTLHTWVLHTQCNKHQLIDQPQAE
jgi:hypothetical protein